MGSPGATTGTTRPTGTGTNGTGTSTNTTTTQTIQIKAASSGNGSATGVPSSSNVLTPSMGDPYSIGLPSKFTKGPPTNPTVTFGTANYTSTAQGAAAGGGAATTSTTAAPWAVLV